MQFAKCGIFGYEDTNLFCSMAIGNNKINVVFSYQEHISLNLPNKQHTSYRIGLRIIQKLGKFGLA